MQLLAWSDALKTHIDVIDRQHRGLVDMVNATADRLAAGTKLSSEDVRLLLGYLKDYTEVHFSTEEALMALCGLPPGYTNRHHLNHARFIAHVGDMMENVSEDAVPDGRHLLAFLGDWLIRHIQGEDRGLAQRLHAARVDASLALHSIPPAAETAGAAGSPFSFADALARESAALHASETDVLSLVAESDHAAVVIALDASLMPAKVLHANAAAVALLGRSEEALKAGRASALFGPAQWARFPVLMSEVLVSGDFAGLLDCVAPDGRLASVGARVTYLVLHGQMVLLVQFDWQVGQASETPVQEPFDAAEGEGAAVVALGPGRNVLSRHPLFRDLTPAELARLERASTLVRLAKGELLFDRGDTLANVYIVISGQVSLVVSNNRGAEKVLEIIGPQEMFGEAEVFTDCPSRAFARSLASTVLLAVPAATVRAVQASSRRLACAAAEHLGRRLLEARREIEAITLHTAMERIIDHLLEHARINGFGVLEAVLPAQKQVIASCLNLTPATLSRAFQQLGDAGLVVVNRRYVTIPDRDLLLAFRAQESAERSVRAG